MNNLTKKIVAMIIGLSMVVMMAPSLAQALTADELQVQINALMAQLATLQSQLAALQGTTPAVTGCTITSFTRNLKQGMTGDDVKCLQIVLNSDSATQVAASGVGSSGKETKYFGALTKAAVVKFQEKYAAEVLTPIGLTAGTGFVGAKTIAKLNAILTAGVPPAGVVCGNGTCETGETTANCPADCPAVAAGLTVALAADTPAAGTIVASTTLVELAKIKFTNGDATDVKITNLKLKRLGISDDTTLPSIYLFDGYARLGDEGTLSSGIVTFNVAGGIFTVPAGGSKTISVRADIKTGTTGQTVGIQLVATTDITTDASVVNGTFPISGNLMSIAAATTPAAATLSAATPAANTALDATVDFIAWTSNLTVTQQDAQLEYLRLTQIGSISATDLDNIRLNISGTEVATGKLVAGLVGQDLIFDLSASPIKILKGQTKTLSVYVDMVGGADKTMRFGLEKSADIFLKDLAYNCYISIGGMPNRAGLQTISKGTITMTKATDSPSANVVLSATNVSLAKFNVKANGEEIKINSLQVMIYSDDTIYSLRNGMLLLDGVQVGGTLQILATTTAVTSSTSTYQTFNIYQKIPAGVTKTLEVKADIYGCPTSACSSNGLDTGKTITVYIIGGSWMDNAQGMKSLAMIDAPGASVPGNTLTAGEATLSLVANSAYGNQSVSAGSDTRIGSYKLTAGAYDVANISSFTVTATVAAGMSLTDLSNLYLKYDTKTSSVKGTVVASNVYSVTESLAAGKTMAIDVWATLASDASGTVYTTLTAGATKATDGSSITVSTVTGQTITTKAGLIKVVKAADTPDTAIVTAQTADVLLAKFNFSALYEPFTIKTINIQATSSATSTSKTATTTDDFVSIYLKYTDKDGVAITSEAIPFSGANATFTNQTLNVPSGGTGKLSVYGNMNAVASAGYADSGDGPQLGLAYYIASSGSQPNATGAPALWGNQMVLYKTKPTVGLKGGITTGTLTAGYNDLYAVDIAADSKGDVGLKKLVFYIKGGMATDTDTFSGFKLYKGDTDYTTKVTFATSSQFTGTDTLKGNTATSTMTVTFTTEEVITADTSQIFTLKANLTGGVSSGEYMQTYVLGDASYPVYAGKDLTGPTDYATTTAAYNFVWTDRTYPAYYHGESTADWVNGYLVKTIPSDVYTLKY